MVHRHPVIVVMGPFETVNLIISVALCALLCLAFLKTRVDVG